MRGERMKRTEAEIGGERQRYRERHRQRDTDRDRDRNRDTDTETDRDRNRDRETHTQRGEGEGYLSVVSDAQQHHSSTAAFPVLFPPKDKKTIVCRFSRLFLELAMNGA